jgi:putative effector of murein hydrolase LrgA (UPF0299 family)
MCPRGHADVLLVTLMLFITKILSLVARLPVPARISLVLLFLAAVADGARRSPSA